MDNYISAQILMTFGGLFLVGLVADLIGRYTPLPRVTLLLLAGVVIGPSGFGWLPHFAEQWFPVLTNIALAMIGFMLGQKFTLSSFRRLGQSVFSSSVGVVIVTASVVFVGLYVFGVGFEIALILAAIATATDPAATIDVVSEYDAKGNFTDNLLGIVAVDDVWGLMLFSLLSVVVQGSRGGGDLLHSLATGSWEIGGALLLGVFLGLPMAYLTGRVSPGKATQAEALGMVMLCAGLAVWLDVSYLLAAMVLGFVVANFAKHHERPFHAIAGIEWPFLVLFFLLAGASLRIEAITQVGAIGCGYIVLRVIGRVIGGRIGAMFGKAGMQMTRWMGLALLPQAGVAIGMALIAIQRFPEMKDVVLPIILGTTVFFEILGPVVTRKMLMHVGDIKPSGTNLS